MSGEAGVQVDLRRLGRIGRSVAWPDRELLVVDVEHAVGEALRERALHQQDGGPVVRVAHVARAPVAGLQTEVAVSVTLQTQGDAGILEGLADPAAGLQRIRTS